MSINPETPESTALEIAAQVKPSAPPHPPWQFPGPDPDEEASQFLPHRNFLRFCGCSAAIILMAAMLFLILLFTAFRIKVPHVAVAGVTSAGPQTLNRLRNGTATVLADVKVRNPNAAAFRFGGGGATIYYRETVVGEAATPPGRAKARGTVHMSVAVEISGEKLSGVSRLTEDVKSGSLMMSCVTRIPGDVKIITKKHMVVKTICAVKYDYATGQLTAGHCSQYVIS